jgi:hypothetical protein
MERKSRIVVMDRSVMESTRQGRQPVDQVRFNGMGWEKLVGSVDSNAV